ncbi:MAG: hypothetical protein ABT08_06345 [Microbacterium sp. SCN 71-21]|uniref:helix-turn-helix transcriptional regulator n=1 Tax=Microbacterium sp. SCN 71-21 TaxID=1660116 RepID=UPI00086B04E1|nr:helix-turn-helix transcriptional regulator [Microbacterium sp. SCN 71-21]ODU77550.1 MAG: hypothetical protein ABT08_06345 [Microbacterium sp. SCN 71-21]
MREGHGSHTSAGTVLADEIATEYVRELRLRGLLPDDAGHADEEQAWFRAWATASRLFLQHGVSPVAKANPAAAILSARSFVHLIDGAEILYRLLMLHGANLPGEVRETFRRRAADAVWTELRVAVQLMEQVNVGHSSTREVIDHHIARSLLTEREVAVFDLMTSHASVKEISAQLRISPHTAKHHITNISRKLSATGRRAVLERAREVGLLVVMPAAMIGSIMSDVISSSVPGL